MVNNVLPGSIRLVNKETERVKRLQSRMRKVEAKRQAALQANADPKIINAFDSVIESLDGGYGAIPYRPLKYKVEESVEPYLYNGAIGRVKEAIATDDFSYDWNRRIDYEFEAGLDEEPRLFGAIYDVQVNEDLPEIYQLEVASNAGYALEEVTEGASVKFAYTTSSNRTLKIRHYATGLRYTEDFFMYNRTYMMGDHERDFGIAANALMNHIHMNPLLTATYTGSNATAASSTGDTLIEKIRNTISAAIQTSTTNNRRGPYALICAVADTPSLVQAITDVPQEGSDRFAPNVIGSRGVRTIVEYDGWTGAAGKKEVEYPGVTAGTAYLVSMNPTLRRRYLVSRFKHDLRRREGPGDMLRFIMSEVIWDARFGVYTAPTDVIQKITLPTS